MGFDDHLTVGWVITAVSLAALLALAHRWRDPPVETKPVAVSGTARPRRAVILGLASAALFILVPHAWPVAGTTPDRQMSLPEQLGTWRLSEAVADWRPKALRADQIVEGVYSDGEREVTVFIATAASLGAEVTGASFQILDDKTWWIPAQGPAELCDAIGCLAVERLTLDETKGPRIKDVAILRLVGGEPMVSATRMRLERAWQRLQGAQTEAVVIALSSETAGSLPDDLALDLFRRLRPIVVEQGR